MGSRTSKIVSGLNLVTASSKDQTVQCLEELNKEGVVLYNSTSNKAIPMPKLFITSPAELKNVDISKYLFNGDPITHCKISFKHQGLDHYYDNFYEDNPRYPININSGKEFEVYSLGIAEKYSAGKLEQINGCGYVIKNIKSSTQDLIDLTKFEIYETAELEFEKILMNKVESLAIKIPKTTPEYMVCLYDFKDEPQSSMFIFQEKFSRALSCFNTLESKGYHVWSDSLKREMALRDMKLVNIDCDRECRWSIAGDASFITSDAYLNWCKGALKEKGLNHYYEFDHSKHKTLKVKGGSEDDTYSIGNGELRVNGVHKVDGCKYVIAGFNPKEGNKIDLSGLNGIDHSDLFFQAVYMNDIPTIAVHIDKETPKYLFCVLDHQGELAADNFIFAKD